MIIHQEKGEKLGRVAGIRNESSTVLYSTVHTDRSLLIACKMMCPVEPAGGGGGGGKSPLGLSFPSSGG